jgi:hypothetical protein
MARPGYQDLRTRWSLLTSSDETGLAALKFIGGTGFQPVGGGVLVCHAVTRVVPARLSGLTSELGWERV